jgi:hypothetical protein
MRRKRRRSPTKEPKSSVDAYEKKEKKKSKEPKPESTKPVVRRRKREEVQTRGVHRRGKLEEYKEVKKVLIEEDE